MNERAELWKTLCTCRKADKSMNIYWHKEYWKNQCCFWICFLS